MKLLVIGAQGQLARSLRELTVPPLDLISLGRPQIDLLKPQSISRAIRLIEPQIVINTAAYTAVDEAEEQADLAYALNRDGARHVAEICAETNIPLIHISTDYVFNASGPCPKSEADRAEPLNVYGLTKLAGECAIISACDRHVILRTAWLYSPFGRNFVRTILRLAESRLELRVVDDQIGNPTYALHLALGIVEIGRRLIEGAVESPWGIYHLSGSGEASWYDVAREVLDRSATLGGPVARLCGIKSAEYPTKSKRPLDSRLNGQKCRDTFGTVLPDWRLGVANCVHRILTET